jgi:hypothetical protein
MVAFSPTTTPSTARAPGTAPMAATRSGRIAAGGPASPPWTTTSTPAWAASLRRRADWPTASVSISVPATRATPIVTATAVSASRARRASRPFSVVPSIAAASQPSCPATIGDLPGKHPEPRARC